MKQFDAVIDYIDKCLIAIPTMDSLSDAERATLNFWLTKIKRNILNAIAQLKRDIGEDLHALNALRTLKKYI